MDLGIATLSMSTLTYTEQPELGPALVDLLQWEHIEPDKDNEVNITATRLVSST